MNVLDCVAQKLSRVRAQTTAAPRRCKVNTFQNDVGKHTEYNMKSMSYFKLGTIATNNKNKKTVGTELIIVATFNRVHIAFKE